MKLFAELMLEGNKQALKNNLYTTDNAISGGFGKNVNKKDVKKNSEGGFIEGGARDFTLHRTAGHVAGRNCVCLSLADLY